MGIFKNWFRSENGQVGIAGGNVIVNPTTRQHDKRNDMRIQTLETAINDVQMRMTKSAIDLNVGRTMIAGYKKELERRKLVKRASEV